jgi:hypothetical protein
MPKSASKPAQQGKKRGKGRPKKTVGTGMSEKVLKRQFKDLDALLNNSALKKGILHSLLTSHLQLWINSILILSTAGILRELTRRLALWLILEKMQST